MRFANTGRAIVSALLVVGGLYLLQAVTNPCSRAAWLTAAETTSAREQTAGCRPTAAGLECSFGFEHCNRSDAEQMAMPFGFVALCLGAGALASRGIPPDRVRGAGAVAIGAAVAIALSDWQLTVAELSGASVLIVVAALSGWAGGWLSGNWPNNVFKWRRAKRARP